MARIKVTNHIRFTVKRALQEKALAKGYGVGHTDKTLNECKLPPLSPTRFTLTASVSTFTSERGGVGITGDTIVAFPLPCSRSAPSTAAADAPFLDGAFPLLGPKGKSRSLPAPAAAATAAGLALPPLGTRCDRGRLLRLPMVVGVSAVLMVSTEPSSSPRVVDDMAIAASFCSSRRACGKITWPQNNNSDKNREWRATELASGEEPQS